MRCSKHRARASRRVAPDGGSRSAAPQRTGRPRQQHARDGEGTGAGSRRGVPRPRGRRRAGRQGAGPRERDRRVDRPGLVGLQRVGADQRAGHALVLPRHRRGGGAGRLAAEHDPDSEGGDPADVLFVATMLDQIEAAFGLEPINLHILIETALGMANVEAIAQTCPERLEAMVFGVADYAASTQARTTNIGGSNPDYVTLTHAGESGGRERHWGDQWHFALSRMIVACRAYGLRPIDGPFGDYQDPDGYTAAARSAAQLGCEGKWAIHPSQIALANEVFTPSPEEIDAASIKMAENMVRKADQMPVDVASA